MHVHPEIPLNFDQAINTFAADGNRRIQLKDYKTRGINRKCKANNLDKIRINNKNNETNKGLKQIWVKVLLTMPVTSAPAESSFSALKRIKTYLRSTMVEDRLMVCP
jgi:hypothetical protein